LGRKAASEIMFILVLLATAMLSLAFNIQPAKSEWTGTVYIRADGSIDPPDAPIITYDKVTYTLTGNITSSADGIIVERSNIIIDGNGYVLHGNGTGNGSTLSVINVTIKNMNIKGFENGVFIAKHSSHNIVSGNNITNNSDGIHLEWYSSYNTIAENNIINNSRAIFLTYSANNIIFGNNVRDNDDGIYLSRTSSKNNVLNNTVTNNTIYGIYLSYSPKNIVSGNNITNNEYGIWISPYSPYNTLSENVMNGNKYNFGVEGYELSHFVHLIDDSNLVNGKPVYYLVNQSDLVTNPANYPQVGYLALVNCTNVTVEGLTMTGNGQGLLLANTNNSRIMYNNVANNDYGIYFYRSSNNLLSRNNITNSDRGIFIYRSNNDTISKNNIVINSIGICLAGAHNSVIQGNNITNNSRGITFGFSSSNAIYGNNVMNNSEIGLRFYSSSNNNSISNNNITNNRYWGIHLDESFNNIIHGNNITNNSAGVCLCDSSNNTIFNNDISNHTSIGIDLIWESDNNIITGNNITNNVRGIYIGIRPSSNNFNHNNFIDNTQQVYFMPGSSQPNFWDDGYPSGGNYWSDYYGTDLFKGPNQDQYGSDGIGDAPYIINSRNRDNYPLMYPYGFSPPPYYNLTITATTGGITNPPPGTYSYTAGTTVNVTAIPNVGYSFDYWLLDGEIENKNPITVVMDSNYTLQAYFVDDIPPEISDLWQDPPSNNVQPFQNVAVWVNVTDYGSGIRNVTLWYSLDNGTTWEAPINMTALPIPSDATITYEAIIPGYGNCTWITYKIIAYDNAGNNATQDNNGYYYKYHVIPEFPSITILLLMLIVISIIVPVKRKVLRRKFPT